jgi:hypothetical protein
MVGCLFYCSHQKQPILHIFLQIWYVSTMTAYDYFKYLHTDRLFFSIPLIELVSAYFIYGTAKTKLHTPFVLTQPTNINKTRGLDLSIVRY